MQQLFVVSRSLLLLSKIKQWRSRHPATRCLDQLSDTLALLCLIPLVVEVHLYTTTVRVCRVYSLEAGGRGRNFSLIFGGHEDRVPGVSSDVWTTTN